MATYDLTTTIPASSDLIADDILNCTYSGSEISIELAPGRYKIEAYGGAGGTNSRNSKYTGGEGGYSYGTISLETVTKLYLNAGGKGNNGSSSSSTKNTGGYNGGGYSYYYAGSGGGATHVATVSGLLSTLSSSTDSIIIVAGGGGGSAAYSTSNYSSSSYCGYGGAGGGESGGAGSYGTSYSNTAYAGQGGTQTAGGAAGTNSSRKGSAGSFGSGGNGGTASSSYYGEGGGGGGYYGGGGASGYEAGGGGGSGYLSSQLTDSATSQGGNDDNGYIVITVLEIYSSTHTITFYDGTSVIGMVETGGEEAISLPTPPTKNGYKFLGYFLADGTTQITETVYLSTKLKADVECFAKYRKYKISFYNESTLISTISTTGKEAITFPEVTKDGYQFSLWQLADGTTLNQAYLDGAYLTADLQAQAIFIQKFTVSFICDGTTYKTYETIGYEEISIPDTIPTKTGYVFDGWFLDSSYKTPYSEDYYLSQQITSDITVYGKLSEEVTEEPKAASNINFYVNNELYHTISTKGKEVLVFPENPSVEGYKFNGWYTNTGYTIQFTEDYFEDYWVNKDFSIYAKLTEIQKYNVTYLINGRTYYTYKSAGNEKFKLPTNPTITNYEFEGWYWDDTFKNSYNENEYESKELTTDINIYGKLKYTKKNNIYFYLTSNATSAYSTISTSGMETLTLPDNPTAELGYEFEGWYLDKKYKNSFDITYYESNNLTSDIYVYAKFVVSSAGPYSLIIGMDGTGSVNPDVGTYTITKGTSTELTIEPTTESFKYLEVNGEIVDVTETTSINPSSASAYYTFDGEASDALGRSTTSTSGTPSINTSTTKFGTGSIYFDGTSALGITLPDSFSDEFTVEFWFYTEEYATSGIYPTLFSTNTDNTYGGIYCAVNDGSYGDSMICRANAAGSRANNGTSGSEAAISTWNHFAFSRSGNNNYYFLNGTLMATVTQSNPITVSMICLGGLLRSSAMSSIISSDYFTGYIDDLLISSTCKYTESFTAPTEAYNAKILSKYSYTIENQAVNTTATAYFGELLDFTVTSSASDGTISPSGATVIKEGNTQTYTFYGDSSQELKAFLIDGVAVEVESSGSTYSYTLKHIHSDKTVRAIFSPLLYLKISGKWRGISKVYKKVSGAWVEQENSDLANIFDTSANYAQGTYEETSTATDTTA